jgi:hypothetical protein
MSAVSAADLNDNNETVVSSDLGEELSLLSDVSAIDELYEDDAGSEAVLQSDVKSAAVGETEFYEDDYEVIFSDSIDVHDDESRLISYEFYDDVEGSVSVTINGSEVYNAIPGSNDIYLYDLNVDKFDYGTYKVDFIYSGDENYEGFIKSAYVDFTYNFNVYAREDTFEYGSDTEFYVTVPTSTGTVEYVVNGKKIHS